MKTKKIISLLLVLVLTITAVILLVPKKASSSQLPYTGNADYTITMSSSNETQTQEGKTIYIPSSYSNSFDITIKCSAIENDDDTEIRVRYRTRDISAMASKGDYKAVDSEIVFNSTTSLSRSIRVQINKSFYQVDNTYNVFGFEIYSVTSSDYNKTAEYKGDSILYCGIKGNNKFSTATSNGNKVIKEYTQRIKVSLDGIDHSDESKWYEYDFWEYDNQYYSEQYNWENVFCKLGLSRLYIGGGATVDCYDFLKLSDEKIQFEIAHGSGFNEGYSSRNSYSVNSSFYKMYWETDFEDDSFRVGSGHDSCKTVTISTSGRNYSGYCQLPYSGSATSSLSFKYQGWDTCRCCFYSIGFEEILIDYDQPYITSFSTYDGALNSTDTIYITVRFNEPVIVKGSPILVCALNGSLNGDNRNKINLNYCYGSGTDTLCFSYDCKNLLNDTSIPSIKINSLYPVEMKNSNGDRVQIYDMGLNKDNKPNQTFDYRVDGAGANGFKYGNKQKDPYNNDVQRVCDVDTLKCPLNVSIDIRTPQITIAASFQNGISQTNSCNLKVENTTENATVYYTFTTSKNKFQINPDSNFLSYYQYTKHDGFVGSSSYEVGNLSGEYYMHITVVSKFGRCCEDTVIGAQDGGPIRLDNDSPIIHNDSDPKSSDYFIKQNDFKTKIFQFDITDGPEICSSGIAEIYLYYTVDEDSYITFKKEGKVNLWVDPNIVIPSDDEEDDEEEEEPVVPIEPIIEKEYKGFKIKKIYGNSIGASDMVTVKSKTPNLYNLTLTSNDSMWMLDETEFDTFYFGFLVVDAAGNHIPLKDMNIASYDFDNRQIFEAQINLKTGSDPIYPNKDDMEEKKGERVLVYNSSKQIECELEKTSDEAGSNTTLLYIKHNGEDIDPANFSSIVTVTTIDSNKLGLKFAANLCGEYELTFGYDIKVTRAFIFYFANSTNKDTYNKTEIDRVGEIINKVWQLNNPVFYYKESEAKGEEVMDETYYGGTKKLPTFSSYNMAYSYVRFMELQDLDLYYVSEQSWADALNGGRTTDRLLAKGETHVATVGDYYIRYKKADWPVGDITPSSWVYYYYSTEGTDDNTVINAQLLPQRLNDAIDNVSRTIASNGGWHFLTDNELDQYGSPKLESTQYHAFKEVANASISGSNYKVPISYLGDVAIFDNYVTYAGYENLRLLSNRIFTYNKFTKLYYRMKSSENPFVEIQKYDARLKAVTSATGIYEIMEVDENGINIFECFLDGTAPTIKVDAIAKDETKPIDQTISASFDGKTYNARSFRISDMIDTDDWAYIAIYKISAVTTTLKRVISMEDIQNDNSTLDPGYYELRIYDRSGNNFHIFVKTNLTDLECSFTEIPNTSVKFECNRDAVDVQIFEVRFNGELLDNVYEPKKTYYDAGFYEIYLLDWFGNEYPNPDIPDIEKDPSQLGYIDFIRTLPDLKWRYTNGAITYDYDGKQEGMKIVSVDDNVFDLFTNGSVALKYSLGSDYSYEFVGGASPSSARSNLGTETLITIYSEENYSIRIFYTKYPDVGVTYNVHFDTKAPDVSVSSTQFDYENNENLEIKKYVEDRLDDPSLIDKSLDGKLFIPDSIGYIILEDDPYDHYITSGSKVSSKHINVSLYDDSTCTKVYVYLNGNLLYQDFNDNGVADFTLSRSGNYKIESYDSLGNMSEFTFTNAFSDAVEAKVDGNIVERNSFTNGSLSLSFSTNQIGYYLFKIQSETKNLFYMLFTLENGVLYRMWVSYDSNSESFINFGNDEIILNPSDFQDEYAIGYADGIDFTIYYEEGSYNFVLLASEDETYTVEAKYYNNTDEPFYVEAKLSQEPSYLNIISGDKVIDPTNEIFVNINKEFTLEDPSNNPDITEVTICNITDYIEHTVYDLKNGFIDNTYKGNECYLINVKNIYGVISTIMVEVSDEFNISKVVTLKDGREFTYSGVKDRPIYSNNKVRLNIPSFAPIVSGERNGEAYVPILLVGKTNSFIELTLEGAYKITIEDEFGNIEVINIEIKSSDISFPNDLLTGFNENALLKNSGYTNNLLSVSPISIEKNKISYVSVSLSGSENITVIFDTFSNEGINIEDAKLENSIGNEGTGIYIVTIMDEYGNVATKEIHYRDETTLKLFRTTRSDGLFNPFDISEALNNGFYSNNSVKFETDSINYKFTLDGVEYDLSKQNTWGFPQGVDRGVELHNVTYQDEYGFTLEFFVYLYRVDVDIYARDLSQFTEINATLVTREPFIVDFSENATCTYIYNQERYDYAEGQIISKDGIYVFEAVDFAGNISKVTYKKDSVCEYTLTDTEGGKVLESGDVSNNDRVVFMGVNQDKVSIYKAYRDGKLLEDFKDDKFSEAGHYELIIKDEVGNTSYFEFYIITHELKGFSYQTPYTYKVTKLNYVSGEGVIVSVIGYVFNDEENYNQSFSFGSINGRETVEEDGYYEVVMYSEIFGKYSTFTFTIDNVMPHVRLVGCEDGEETVETITIENYSVGDTIRVYKDGKLIKTIKVLTESTKMPEIVDGGEYVIEIENLAGLTQKLTFKRIHISNAAGSALIIIGGIVFVVVLFIGLMYRTKSKVDK